MVEGNKIIKELQNSKFRLDKIYTLEPDLLDFPSSILEPITAAELKKISFLQHPKDSLAVCCLPNTPTLLDTEVNLVLDGIQDPGNLGTIIRLADWFGIEQIICSPDTVDVYNPKVIQATMGSFIRINIVYTPLVDYLATTQNENVGTDMEGENLYSMDMPQKINLILGNEGNGIRPSTREYLKRKITIPRFGKHRTTESLNVSMAAGIILGQLFGNRKNIK